MKKKNEKKYVKRVYMDLYIICTQLLTQTAHKYYYAST